LYKFLPILSAVEILGSGARKGFGEIEIAKCVVKKYDLKIDDERQEYLNKSSSLNSKIKNGENKKEENSIEDSIWRTYELRLNPDDFFLFGSGCEDNEVNMKPVSEIYFSWQENSPVCNTETLLIPSTSVKGTLSHRVAFHYNRLSGVFCDDISVNEQESYVGEKNEAVKILFGYVGKDESGNNDAQRGNVLISDLIQKRKTEVVKVLNHVAIDRFTGGTIDGALFSEKVMSGNNETYTLVFKVNECVFENKKIEESFHSALIDIASGMLPLGGGVNRGHGIFTGEVLKDKELLYKYEKEKNHE
jgi:hypothetical protein